MRRRHGPHVGEPRRIPRVLVVGGALGVLLLGCGGTGTDDAGTGGTGSGGTIASGGASSTGGAVGSGGATSNSGGSSSGTGGMGGSDSGEFDPEDLGTPCEGGACPAGLTPTEFELCGIASCDTVCECHLPCTSSPDSCPEGLSCQTGGFNLPENVCL